MSGKLFITRAPELPGALTQCEVEMLRRFQAIGGLIYPEWKYFSAEEAQAVYSLVGFKYLRPVAHGGYALVNRGRR